REIKKISVEKEQTLKKLIESEKMAYLGQMAAGIAHELNNSIAVVGSNAVWIGEKMDKEMEELFPGYFSVFRLGLEKGNRLTSSQIRERAGEIAEQYGVDSRSAKRLAQTEIPVASLSEFTSKKGRAEKVCDLWELGSVVHDIKVAATQASHVVKSVKQLGRPEPARKEPVDINDTIFAALTLLRYQLKGIKNDFSQGEAGTLEASQGNLVQIWVNLIKNAG
ncbi:MAG: histidine kinase, partial [Nitrospinota bacterium]